MPNPHPEKHQKHIESVAEKLRVKAAKYQVPSAKFQADLDRALNDPTVTRLFDLAAAGDEVAQVEGSARLKTTLLTVAALAEHFKSAGPPGIDPVADRVEAAVAYALTGELPRA